MINRDISYTIGKTPLVRINGLSRERGVNFIAKIESRNPSGSIKCRVGYSMIDDAEKSGILKPGMQIIEPTSGNTGIALASIGRARGYRVTIVMPESMSVERRKVIQGFGAELVLTSAEKGVSGAIEKAGALMEEYPGRYFMPDQFSNAANPAIHALTTGPEIELDSSGKADMVVAGVGTGGTISGIGWYYKMIMKKKIKIVAVEPSKSPVITQTLAGTAPTPSLHQIQGIGAGFIPKTLDLNILDHVVTVDDEEAIEYARRLMKQEGILCGISGGAAVAGAVKASKHLVNDPANVVIIIPDSGERYISTALYMD